MLRASFLSSIRRFFEEKGFLEALTPPMVENPGMEPHIHPFEVIGAKDQISKGYLQTSPEFHMKELLSHGLEKIYNISYCFRDEPQGQHHRNQFIMLEWYRANVYYEQIEKDSRDLIDYLIINCPHVDSNWREKEWSCLTVEEAIQKFCRFSILEHLEVDSLRKRIEADFKDVPLPPEELSWDDLFFLLFLNKVEPKLKKYPLLILKEYPHHLSALSTLKKKDPRVCERFEIYLNGVEVGNCFNELTDYKEQISRFQKDETLKQELYGYKLPFPKVMESSLKRGLPTSAGIAVGVERLAAELSGSNHCFWSE